MRSGLAPLELVMALPLLLSVMALIVNFAHLATWKIRAQTNARLAMWRHRPMWNADGDPKPSNYWPQGATMGVSGSNRISQVDAVWNQPLIAQPWIKGPVFAVNGGYLALRDNRVNEMGEGVSKGNGGLNMRFPYLPAMGSMSLDVPNTLLDNVWQFHSMGYSFNDSRRALGWWQVEDSPDWAQQKQMYLQADMLLTGNPQRELMRPLDRDRDLVAFFNGSIPAANSYAILRVDCDINDPNDFRQRHIINPGGLVDQIKGRRGNPRTPGVNERMSRKYLNMYQTELAIRLLEMPQNGARIAQLRQWIQELNDFINTL